MSKIVARLFLVLMLTFAGQELFASNPAIYAVGSCRPTLPTFPTITAALAANPQATTVMICPGTYNEQLQITRAVSLQGVSDGNSNQVILGVPSGGLATNATSSAGDAIAAQVWIDNAGAVNLSDITIDATGSGVSFFPPYLVGIFYQDTNGIVNRITTRNQKGNGFGVGFWLEGGFGSPSVTIENSSIHDFDSRGFLIESNTADSELTATIKGNEIDGSNASLVVGVVVGGGATATITNNLIVRTNTAVFAAGAAAGSISANTLTNNSFGIHASADAVSVSSNKIFASGATGILLGSAIATVQANSITESGVGIDLACLANGNVKSNIFTDVTTGLADVPASVTTSNTYFSVGVIRGGGC